MSDIEQKTKPIMLPLITGESAKAGTKIRISPSDQTILATWAVLKAMVAAYDNGSKVRIHHMQRKYMRSKRRAPTEGWGVWIGHYERIWWKPEYVSQPTLLLPDKPNRKSYVANYHNGSIITQVLGNLFIHVIHTPHPRLIKRWTFPDPQNGTLFRIWPASGFSILWPGNTLTDRDADNIAAALGEFILSVQRGHFGPLS